ncbi:ANTAR domain-containing protein [Janibacter alittae]|uniref:ANTAR domain-containing protein n=1 Tax=Janibacter alittae TaxID=3115209 RepID=UPI003BB09BD0
MPRGVPRRHRREYRAVETLRAIADLGPARYVRGPAQDLGGVAGDPEQVFTDLTRAVATRTVTGRATGILMERHHLTETAALESLTTAAPRPGHRLSWVAEHVATTGANPSFADVGHLDLVTSLVCGTSTARSSE